jgi:hypothetical protein
VEVVNNTKQVTTTKPFSHQTVSWNYTTTNHGKYTVRVRTESMNDDNSDNNISVKYLMVPIIMKDSSSYAGENKGDRFGWNVSYAGDINSDGFSDIIIGAPYNDSADGSHADAGAAYVFYGPLKGNYSASTANVTIYGTMSNDHFGWDLASGDIMNGTSGDIVIGAPGNSSTMTGKAYVFDGTTIANDADGTLYSDDADAIIDGETNGDRFGCSVAGSGDVDNAGNGDIIIGAYLNDNNGLNNNGRAYIFFGDGSLPSGAINADKILNGSTDDEFFGFSTSFAGDMDGDSTDDFIIGAPGSEGDKGRVYLFGGFVTLPTNARTYDFSLGGGYNKWFFHKNTGKDDPPSTGPDIEGENILISYSTIAYSDNIWTPVQPDSANSGSSGDYNRHHFKFKIKEPVTCIKSFSLEWEGYDTAASLKLYIWNTSGVGAWELVGSAGSKYPDKVITKTYTQSIGNYIDSYTGLMDFVVTSKDGSNSFWEYLLTDYVKVDIINNPYTGNSFNKIICGESHGDRFGFAVNSSGDFNGDSYDDVVVGAPDYDNSSGRAYIYLGSKCLDSELPVEATIANTTIHVGSPGDRFGYSVANINVGYDNYSDVAVGAPNNDTWDGSVSNAGAVYVFEGAGSPPAAVTVPNFNRYGANSNDRLGWALSTAMDVNDDNFDEIIVGAPFVKNGTLLNSGQVYVFTVIPEYSHAAIPVAMTMIIFVGWRRKKKRTQ